MLLYFDPIHYPDFGTDFQLEKEGILTSVHHGNSSYNCELDVRFESPNWTSIAQAMVHFSELP